MLARRNRKTLGIWARGNRGYNYYYVSEKNMRYFPYFFPCKKSPCPTEHSCLLILTNTHAHDYFKCVEKNSKKLGDYLGLNLTKGGMELLLIPVSF